MNTGIWLNLWNYPNDIQSFLSDLEKHHINTIYLQIGRSNTDAIKNPVYVKELISQAKEKNIKVIGWLYAFLENPEEDAQKFLEGASLKNLAGMAVDLEENVESEKVNLFAKKVRKTLGEKYNLIAITYSPIIRPLNGSNYPWKTIAENFDVIAPMLYWNKITQEPSQVYALTSQALSDLKDFLTTNKKNIRANLIYPIGDLQGTSPEEIKSFTKASLDQEIINNISLYPYHLSSSETLAILTKELQIHCSFKN